MLLLATPGLGLARAAKQGEGAFAEFLVFNGSHPQWNSQFAFLGVSVWDLIQPAFMFIVGVSMPFSYEKRARLGQSYGSRMRHAWTRAILLTLLGVFLQSRWGDTNWLFTNVLSQIGLGYGFLFFLVGRSWKTQVTAGAAVLVGYYILMVLLPRGLESWRAHFADGTSLPQQFDLWFLNPFPREKPFDGHAYSTLNFVPSFVTMLMGLMAGQLLKSGGKSKNADNSGDYPLDRRCDSRSDDLSCREEIMEPILGAFQRRLCDRLARALLLDHRRQKMEQMGISLCHRWPESAGDVCHRNALQGIRESQSASTPS
jgi:hypothetical protein